MTFLKINEVNLEKLPDQKKYIFKRGTSFRTSCALRVNLKTKATHWPNGREWWEIIKGFASFDISFNEGLN